MADNLSKFLRDIDDPEPRRRGRRAGRHGDTGRHGADRLHRDRGAPQLRLLPDRGDQPVRPDRPPPPLLALRRRNRPLRQLRRGELQRRARRARRRRLGTTTNILKAARCVAWLGRNQPGINQDLDLPPYDQLRLPAGGSDRHEHSAIRAARCAADRAPPRPPAERRAAPAGSGRRRHAAAPAATRRLGGSAPPGTGRPDVAPERSDDPGTGQPTPTPPAQRPGAPSSGRRRNDDLLGFLFGTDGRPASATSVRWPPSPRRRRWSARSRR